LKDTTVTACGSFTWDRNGQTYTTTTTDDVLIPNGACVDTVRLHLTIGTGAVKDTTVAACGSFTWDRNGLTYTTTTTDAVLIPNGPCVDTVRLHLTIGRGSHTSLDVTACDSYTWVRGNGNTYTMSGSYDYITINATGCEDTATLNLTISNGTPNIVITDPAAVCEPGTVDLTSPNITSGSDNGLTYTYWMDASSTVPVPNPNAITQSGTYYITGATAGGCASTKSVQVTVKVNKATPGVTYPSVSTAPNTSLQLNARDLGIGYTYQWYPPAGINFDDIKNPTFNYNQQTKYTITLTPPDGNCPTVDTLLVTISDRIPGGCVSKIDVPNAWSPNGDGHNDKLYPLTICMKELKYFRVYDRWGQLMFETHTLGQGWDGTFKGQPQVMDVYTWIVEAEGLDGVHYKQAGNSILMR
jgi:gliding motility-associated-like protein